MCLTAFVSALGSHEMGRHKLLIIVVVVSLCTYHRERRKVLTLNVAFIPFSPQILVENVLITAGLCTPVRCLTYNKNQRCRRVATNTPAGLTWGILSLYIRV